VNQRPLATGIEPEVLDVVEEWLDSPSWDALLAAFSLRQPTASDVDSILSEVETNAASWAGGDTIDTQPLRSLNESAIAERIRIAAGRLLALEQAAEFCWNFRRGIPVGLVHLFRTVLSLRKHVLLPEPLRPDLPLIASTRWSDPKAQSELAAEYIGQESAERLHLIATDDVAATVAELEALIDALLPTGPAQRVSFTDVMMYPDVRSIPYRERWQAAAMHFSDRRRECVSNAADALGLVTPTQPSRQEYAHAAVLGGGGLTPLLRARYLEELIEHHQLKLGQVWMLGSPRPIDEDKERLATDTYAKDAADEFDLMCAAAEAAFSATDPTTQLDCGCADDQKPCPVWGERMAGRGIEQHRIEATAAELQHSRQRVYRSSRVGPIRVLGAATGNPPKRPNTADTYEFLGSAADHQPGDRALIVTTQVFYPFQGFDALRMLAIPSRLMTETVGFGADRSDRPNTAEFNLQEILSGIRSARRLVFALAAQRFDGAPDESVSSSLARPVVPLTAMQSETIARNARTLFRRARRSDALDLAKWLEPRAVRTAESLRLQFQKDGPTDKVVDALFMLGWMLYEVTFPLIDHHGAEEEGPESRAIRDILRRLAECAESIEPKQYAARAGGAIRAYALALSKVDRTDTYLLAQRQHDAADRWIGQLLKNAGSDERLRNEAWAVHVQLEVAKAGTSCRQVETFLCDPDKLDAGATIETRLRQVAASGRIAVLAGVAALESFRQLPPGVVADRRESLAERFWERQPSNMAARGHLLIVPALAALQALGMPYPEALVQNVWAASERTVGVSDDCPTSYDEEIEFHRVQTVALIRTAELAMVEAKGDQLVSEDVAETARMRLHYLLQFPTFGLEAPNVLLSYGPSSATPLDALDEIDHLTQWLEDIGHGTRAIGGATLAPWVQGLIDVRRRYGVDGGYLEWRKAHPKLDHFLRKDPEGESDDPEIVRHREQLRALFAQLER
jgi:hypothetical protein